MTVYNNQSLSSWPKEREREKERSRRVSICSPTRKSGSPGIGFLEEDPRERWSLCLYIEAFLPRPAGEQWRRCGRRRRRRRRAEGARKERGLTRCRGGSQGTWEMHSSRCQSPHQAAAGPPPGPTTGPPRGPGRAIAADRGAAHRDPAVSLDWTIRRAIASLAGHRDDRVVEKFHGKGPLDPLATERRRRPVSDRQQRGTADVPVGIRF